MLDRLELKKVQFIGQTFGGFELFCGDEEAEFRSGDHNMILSYFTSPDDDWSYVMLVNNSCTENAHHTLALRGPIAEAQELICDGYWRDMSGPLPDDGIVIRTQTAMELPHWYAPGQAVLYRYRRNA